MSIHIHRDKILPVLSHLSAVVDRSQTLLIFSHILLSYKDGKVSLTGKNSEMELSISTKAKGDEPEKFTLPARKFFEICRNLPEGSVITLETDQKDSVTLKSARSRFSLRTLDAETFPQTQKDESNESLFTLQAAQLKGLVQSTSASMAVADVRYYLNGMLFEVTEQALTVVATDAHRLSLHRAELSQKVEPFQRILPRRAITELIRFLDVGEDEIKIQAQDKKIIFETPSWTFACQLIEGRYPQYQGLVRKDQKNKGKVTREAFLTALQRVSVISDENRNRVDLHIKNGVMKLYCNNNQQEEAEEEIAIEGVVFETEIGFNIRYLLDALRSLESEKVDFLIEGEQTSATLLDPGNDRLIHMVMPLRS